MDTHAKPRAASARSGRRGTGIPDQINQEYTAFAATPSTTRWTDFTPAACALRDELLRDELGRIRARHNLDLNDPPTREGVCGTEFLFANEVVGRVCERLEALMHVGAVSDDPEQRDRALAAAQFVFRWGGGGSVRARLAELLDLPAPVSSIPSAPKAMLDAYRERMEQLARGEDTPDCAWWQWYERMKSVEVAA